MSASVRSRCYLGGRRAVVRNRQPGGFGSRAPYRGGDQHDLADSRTTVRQAAEGGAQSVAPAQREASGRLVSEFEAKSARHKFAEHRPVIGTLQPVWRASV